MSSSERSIPHLRDIFGITGYTNHHHHSRNLNNHNNITHYQNGIDPYQSQQLQDHQQQQLQQQQQQKNSSKKKRDNSKTLTSGDVKTLERHLSMKKTIRKKIMRDLQQAFVEDPNEFRIENPNQEQLKAEIRVEALRFGNDNNKPTNHKSDNFLDMLRGDKLNSTNNYDYHSNSNGNNHHHSASNREYDYDSPTPVVTEKQSFWRRFTMKNKTKR